MEQRTMERYIKLLGMILLVGCNSNNSSTNSDDSTTYIRIVSVTPETVVENVLTEFNIEVEYHLAGHAQGEISVGFNDEEEASYRIYIDHVVDAGSGTLGYKLEASPVDYSPHGAFSVYANIAEYPHETTYSPIASDTYDLAVTSSSATGHDDQADLDTVCFTDYGTQCVKY
ncbi:MAG: hypothetical protein ABW076_09140 [Candidatus Thiodiazotropha sp.]